MKEIIIALIICVTVVAIIIINHKMGSGKN